jgi:hypothetical protein
MTCCCGVTDIPNMHQRCLEAGLDLGHCNYPEEWCIGCPLDKDDK